MQKSRGPYQYFKTNFFFVLFDFSFNVFFYRMSNGFTSCSCDIYIVKAPLSKSTNNAQNANTLATFKSVSTFACYRFARWGSASFFSSPRRAECLRWTSGETRESRQFTVRTVCSPRPVESPVVRIPLRCWTSGGRRSGPLMVSSKRCPPYSMPKVPHPR